VPRVTTAELLSAAAPAPTGAADARSAQAVREQVHAARARQMQRSGCLNARLEVGRLAGFCALDAAGRRLLAAGRERWRFRSRHARVLRVARTIADLEGCDRSPPRTWPRRCSCGGCRRR
jgi:magnesium chelatase family protein